MTAKEQLGEGVRWDAQRGELLRVDILVGRVYRFDTDATGTPAAPFRPVSDWWAEANR